MKHIKRIILIIALLSIPSLCLGEEVGTEVIDLIPSATSTPMPPIPTNTPEPTPTNTPSPTETPIINEYDLDKEEVIILARLMWSSPLRSVKYKKALCWIVFNRIEDNSGLFGDTIETCVKKCEFAFYDSDAHVSEENYKIATDCLNEYLSWKEGNNIGYHIPMNCLYIEFTGDKNSVMNVYKEIGGNPTYVTR